MSSEHGLIPMKIKTRLYTRSGQQQAGTVVVVVYRAHRVLLGPGQCSAHCVIVWARLQAVVGLFVIAMLIG